MKGFLKISTPEEQLVKIERQLVPFLDGLALNRGLGIACTQAALKLGCGKKAAECEFWSLQSRLWKLDAEKGRNLLDGGSPKYVLGSYGRDILHREVEA